MREELSARAAGIGALAEPVRRDLYLFVAGEPEPVSREQAADALDVPLHTAKFHLDRLVDEGLLEVEFRRLSGRTGPGAGRPSKLYRRSARELAVSLPERRYDLAGRILAAGVDRAAREDVAVTEAVHAAAEDQGRRLGQEARALTVDQPARRHRAVDRPADAPGADAPGADAPGADESALDRAAAALAAEGYEPRRRGEEIVLANCPFDALVHDHTALVCGLNEAFVTGLLDGAGCPGLEACLDKEESLCCVKVRPRTQS